MSLLDGFERCSDEVCRACDLRTQLVKNRKILRGPPIRHGHFYILLVEIDSDGRIDHELNFEILPGYARIVEGQEPEWTVLRSGCGELEYHDWSVAVISHLHLPLPPWQGDGAIWEDPDDPRSL